MPPGLLIRNARQLLTLRGPSGPRRGNSLLEIGLIPDGAVIIRDGMIQNVGGVRQVLSLAAARDCEEIDASGKVVMPAFVDLETSLVHAHPPARTFERMFQDYDHKDSEVFRDALHDGARAISVLSSHSLRRRATSITHGMMQHGTGTVESRSGYFLGETDAMKVLRVQSQCCGPAEVISTFLLQPPTAVDPDAWCDYVCAELLPLVHRRKLAQIVDLEFGSRSLPPALGLRMLKAAAQLGFPTKVSADVFATDSAAAFAIRASVFSLGTLRYVTQDETRALAATSIIAVFRPGLSLQTGIHGCEPGRDLVDAGVIPALASGYHAQLSPGYSMQLMVTLAARLYRWRPEEAIVAATINNAYALRAEASIGSIESCKQADILVLKVSDYREVGYYPGVNIVDKVLKRGVVVYDSKDAARHDDPD